MKTKSVLHSNSTGGSKHGFSKYRRWLGCTQRAYYEENYPNAETPYELLVGTIYHAYKEVYHTNQLQRIDTNAIEIDFTGVVCDQLDQARAEAERLFRFYRTLFSPSHLGKVIVCEQLVEGTINSLPVSAILDLVVKVEVKDLDKYSKLGLTLSPGNYAVDYKTASYRSETLIQKYQHDLQFVIQRDLWNYNYPKQKLTGSLVEIIYKTKVPKVELIKTVLDDGMGMTLVENTLSTIMERKKTVERNVDQCFVYSTCPYFNRCREEI